MIPVTPERIKSNIPKLYAYSFFHHLVFAYVIERLFWAQRGITVPQVVFLEILYSMVVLLLEVPTGALADKYGRKRVMILSAVLAFGEIFILIHARGVLQFALAILSAAVSKALASGTLHALVYDSLAATGETERFETVLGRMNSLASVAAALSALAGAAVASRYPLVSTYRLSLISLILALLVALFCVEPHRVQTESRLPVWSYARTAGGFLRRRTDILRVVVHGMAVSATLIYVDEFWALYLDEMHVPVGYFGVFSVLISLSVSAGALIAPKFKARATSGQAPYLLLLLAYGGTLTVVGILRSFLGIPLLLLAYFLSGLCEPLVSGYLHHRTASEHRATVESFRSLGERVAASLVGVAFGHVVSRSTVAHGFAFLGATLLCYVLPCWALFVGERCLKRPSGGHPASTTGP